MMLLFRRWSRLSYDGWLIELLAVLSVTSVSVVFSVAEPDDRWPQARILDEDGEDHLSPSMDVDGFHGLDGKPDDILSNDARQKSFGIDDYIYPSTGKRRKSAALRHLIGKESGINDDEEEVHEKGGDTFESEEQLDRDYDDAVHSTNDFVRLPHRPMTSSSSSSNGSLKVVVDLLVVVDFKLFNKFLLRHKNTNDTVEKIKKYYSHVITLIDFRYSQIQDSELSIRVRLAGFFIAQDSRDSPWSEKQVRVVNNSPVVDPLAALRNFTDWLVEKNGSLPKFDHAIGFTGYAMEATDGRILGGMAYRDSMCRVVEGWSSSIILERGGLSSVATAVHELGHSFGAVHDGDGEARSCPAMKDYIMAPTTSLNETFFKNHFLFSSCSIQAIKSALRSRDVQCLYDSVPDKISVLPGRVISTDDMCKDVYGQTSRTCNSSEPEGLFCTLLWCENPTNAKLCSTFHTLTPVLGTPCGDGKICGNGECLNETEVLESLKKINDRANYSMQLSPTEDNTIDFVHLLRSESKRNSIDRNAKRTQARALADYMSTQD